jgi:2-dehydropantoate 2-reductase
VSAILRPEAVLGGVCYVGSFVSAPGVIRQQSQYRRIVMGELTGPITPRVEAIAAAVQRSGATGETSADIQKVLWTKYTFIAPFSGVGAVTRVPAGEIWACPEARRLLQDAMCEVEAVARGEGIRLDEDVVPKTMSFFANLVPGLLASMQRDILAGRRSELASLVGTMVRKGAELGVPVPTFRFCYAALLPQERAAQRH